MLSQKHYFGLQTIYSRDTFLLKQVNLDFSHQFYTKNKHEITRSLYFKFWKPGENKSY